MGGSGGLAGGQREGNVETPTEDSAKKKGGVAVGERGNGKLSCSDSSI